MFLFTLCNTFCAVVIKVGYEAFAQGARWSVHAPVCYTKRCEGDIELHLWLLICIRHIAIPLVRYFVSYFKFRVVKLSIEKAALQRLVANQQVLPPRPSTSAADASLDGCGLCICCCSMLMRGRLLVATQGGPSCKVCLGACTNGMLL